jgi:hypothetical protein
MPLSAGTVSRLTWARSYSMEWSIRPVTRSQLYLRVNIHPDDCVGVFAYFEREYHDIVMTLF